ncbi:hypothetical protein [Treponema phagedenis]|uniref:hypothetical protein n=1 Tax=Treponema phagedenis TaxID=162 RepID=UPI00197CD4F6|nr:hypothetical protein [Treponema phagedenis]QSH95103.1 hypothetical protein C5O78_08650 [Treponema phagedenis]
MGLKSKLDEQLLEVQKNLPSTLNPDDALTNKNWNCVVASIKAIYEALQAAASTPPSIPPIGFLYTRFPGMPLPWEQFTDTAPVEWKNLHEKYPGTFLRLAGGNASAFSGSGSVSYDSGVRGNGGGQIDAMQRHTHSYTYEGSNGVGSTKGVDAQYQWQQENKSSTTGSASGRETEETRPKNITVEMYLFVGQ